MAAKMNQSNYSPITDCLFTSNTERGSNGTQSGPGMEWAMRRAISFGLFHSALMNVNAWGLEIRATVWPHAVYVFLTERHWGKLHLAADTVIKVLNLQSNQNPVLKFSAECATEGEVKKQLPFKQIIHILIMMAFQ